MRSKAPLILMEQMVMLLVFALAAALCLQAFVKSDALSSRSEARDRALLEAQNAAEALKSRDNSYFDTMCARVNGSAGYRIDYGEDWEPINYDACGMEAPEAVYYLMTAWTDNSGPDYLWTADVSVYMENGDLLVTLPVAGQNGGERP
nr:hypothetical protein [uncultured Oscillibacter sp.]